MATETKYSFGTRTGAYYHRLQFRGEKWVNCRGVECKDPKDHRPQSEWVFPCPRCFPPPKTP